MLMIWYVLAALVCLCTAGWLYIHKRQFLLAAAAAALWFLITVGVSLPGEIISRDLVGISQSLFSKGHAFFIVVLLLVEVVIGYLLLNDSHTWSAFQSNLKWWLAIFVMTLVIGGIYYVGSGMSFGPHGALVGGVAAVIIFLSRFSTYYRTVRVAPISAKPFREQD